LRIGSELIVGGTIAKPVENNYSVILDRATIRTRDEVVTTTSSLGSTPFELTFVRGACLGVCPVYEIKISTDGTLIYTGKFAVKEEGLRQSKLSSVQINELVEAFYRVGFFSLEDEYTGDWTDFPTIRITAKISDNTHAVVHDTSSHLAPRRLYLLEEKIDEIVNTRQWTGAVDEILKQKR
jgi:hypothetical protein